MTQPAKRQPSQQQVARWLRLLLVLVFLYLFLVGVGLLEGGIRNFGDGFEQRLLASVDNPLAGLFAGVAATVIVQSSSITTATIVGLVGAGTLPVSLAVPMVMGANIGTTITNTLVSLGSLRRREEFRRAFAAATVHDVFNLIAVVILFPVELLTGFFSRAATRLGGALSGAGVRGGEADSPIREAVRAGTGLVEGALERLTGPGPLLGGLLLFAGIALLFAALRFVTRNMRVVLAGGIEQALNRVLDRGGGLLGMLAGVLITVLVMSSTITTSILVPMVAAGVLATRNAYPVTLGANIGTTATALIASLAVVLPEGLIIALVHTLFNVTAIALLYPVPRIRRVPLRLAEALAAKADANRGLIAVYVAGVFIVVPLVGVALLA